MANVRIKDFAKTATSMASDDNVALDGATNGTRKMTSGSLKTDLASSFAAAPTTYKLAPLNASNKVPTTYLPAGSEDYKGTWDASANSPSLADGVGTEGDVYDVVVAASRDLGSGSQSFALGDQVKYDGTVWNLIPGTSNVLNGYPTAALARPVLEVNSIDDVAEAIAVKMNGPVMSFNGSSAYIEVADDNKLSFNSTEPFSIAGWIYMGDSTSFPVLAKADTGSTREYRFGTDSSDKLELALRDNGAAVEAIRKTDSAISAYQGQWIHVAATYTGTSAATACADDIALYINGVAQDSTATNNGSHTGMVNTTGVVYIGRVASTYAFGKMSGVTLWNRALSAAEVQEAMWQGLVDVDEWGGETAGTTYTSDFSAGVDSWTANNGTAAGNIDAIGGQDNNLRLTIDATSSTHSLSRVISMTNGKMYRISFDYYIPSTNSHLDGLQLTRTSDGTSLFTDQGAATDAWNSATVDVEFDESGGIQVVAMDGASTTISDAGGDDVLYVRNVKVTQVGIIGSWQARNFIDGKVLDASDNALHGTNNSATIANQLKAVEIDTGAASAGNKVLNIHDGTNDLAFIDDQGDADFNSISSGASTELTIATGAVTATKSFHTIDTESDAASDDLDTIGGGRAGQRLVVMANNSARTVVLKDGTGNLKLTGDISLDNAEDTAELISDGTNWYLLSTSNNGA